MIWILPLDCNYMFETYYLKMHLIVTVWRKFALFIFLKVEFFYILHTSIGIYVIQEIRIAIIVFYNSLRVCTWAISTESMTTELLWFILIIHKISVKRIRMINAIRHTCTCVNTFNQTYVLLLVRFETNFCRQ